MVVGFETVTASVVDNVEKYDGDDDDVIEIEDNVGDVDDDDAEGDGNGGVVKVEEDVDDVEVKGGEKLDNDTVGDVDEVNCANNGGEVNVCARVDDDGDDNVEEDSKNIEVEADEDNAIDDAVRETCLHSAPEHELCSFLEDESPKLGLGTEVVVRIKVDVGIEAEAVVTPTIDMDCPQFPLEQED